jgi:putative hydroxymethylpyrimidine transport system substrate-binding protein
MRRLALVGLVAVLVGGCGTRHETVTPRRTLPLRVALVAPNAAQAPIYAAAANGQFRSAGLAVTAREAASPVESLRQLASGATDLAVSTEPALLEARARGERVVSVAALSPQPLSSAIWLPAAGIRSPGDLARKTVGTHGLDYEQAFLRTLARHPVKTRNVGSGGVQALQRRQVPAIVGSWNQEAIQLSSRRPTVKRFDQAGVPPNNGLVLVARAAAAADPIRSFLGALVRSTRDLLRRQPAATAAFVAAARGVDRRTAIAMLTQTLPTLAPPPPHPYGYQDPALWRPFAQWMRANGLAAPRDVAAAYTNRYLPGAGP